MFDAVTGSVDVLVPIAAAMLAVCLALFAWRGRRVGEQTVCRACDYDLRGGQAERCSACGADLTKANATAIGVRQQYRGLLVAASLITVLCGAWAALIGVASVTYISGVNLASNADLIGQLQSGSTGASRAWRELQLRRSKGELDEDDLRLWFDASDELVAKQTAMRVPVIDGQMKQLLSALPADEGVDLTPYWTALAGIVAGPADGESDPVRRADAAEALLGWYDEGAIAGGAREVPDALLARLVEPLLATQADRDVPWHEAFGDLLLVAHQRNVMLQSGLERYATTGLASEVELRPLLRIGDRFPIKVTTQRRLHSPPARRPGNPDWQIKLQRIRLLLDGQHVVPQGPQQYGKNRDPGDGTRTYYLYPIVEQMPPPGELEAELQLLLAAEVPGREPVAEWDASRQISLTLVGKDEVAVELVDDDALRDAVEGAIQIAMNGPMSPTGNLINKPETADSPPAIILSSRRNKAIAFTFISQPPIDMAVEMYLRDPDAGTTWGPMLPTVPLVREGESAAPIFARNLDALPGLSDFKGEALDVILRPRPSATARHVDVLRIWGRPIVLHGQAVKVE